MTTGPRVVDFFCGAGGFSCGLRKAGFDIAAGVDFDKAALETFHENFPTSTTIRADLARDLPASLLSYLRDLRPDVVVGGPPCQGFSVANNERSTKKHNKLNDLTLHFTKTAISLDPSVVIMEEVPAFRRSPNYPKVIKSFQDAGYFVTSKVLNASDYQTPQSRKRNILIANRTKPIPPPEPHGGERLSAGHALSGAGVMPGHEVANPALRAKIMERERGVVRDSFKTKYKVMDTSKPSPTITTNFMKPSSGAFTLKRRGKYYHMSNEEASALQGFPLTFAFWGNITETSKQIGNAIPPPLAFAVGKQVLKYIS